MVKEMADRVSERELCEHITKAVVSLETAPKAKHVRSIVLYSWNNNTTGPFWTQLMLEPVFADEIVCFKALITIHKLLRDGHPNALKEAMQNTKFFDSCINQTARAARFYGDLIRSYVAFIRTKLDFHKRNPEFSGNMSYSDYISLKKALVPDECWQTVTELLKLQEDVIDMGRKVFASFRERSSNECRMASLVPLVEESYGIYQFLLSMLRAMHGGANTDISVFADLRDQFNEQHLILHKFYYDCSALRYLTSLIAVPELDPNPPSLYDTSKARAPPMPARSNAAPAPVPVVDDGALQRALAENRALQDQLRQYQQRYEQDQQRISELYMRNQALESEMLTVKGLLYEEQRRNAELTAQLKRQNDEIGPLRTKADKLQEMYTAMRAEHLPLLQQKQQFAAAREAYNKAKQAVEQLQKAKQTEVDERKRDQEQFQQQLKVMDESYAAEMERLRQQNAEQAQQMEALSASRGDEVETLVRRYNAEKAALEQTHQEKMHEIEQLRNELNQVRAEMRQAAAAKDEEIAVLQVGLDESLERLHELQQSADAAKQQFETTLRTLHQQQALELNKLLDEVLDNSARKLEEAVTQMDSPLHMGNQSATPEYTVLNAEKASNAANDFAAAVLSFASGETPTKAMTVANDITNAMEQLLMNTKGTLRLAGDEHVADEISTNAKNAAKAAQSFLLAAQSTGSIGSLNAADRGGEVERLRQEALRSVEQVVHSIEGLIVKDVQIDQNQDMDDLVEREMLAAAKAIEDAALRLHELMRAPKTMTIGDMNVNQAILEATMGITSSISTLIRAATLAQHEIVAKGRGSATSAQFYKKNHRWTEGLVSAAKAVALATTTMVEAADGVVRGTHTMEQLVVAAHEVAAATAQLVAASRVKADRGSTTQANLEAASRAVSEATKALVSAAKEAALRKMEESNRVDLSKLSIGQLKRQDMEQQVRILTLEKELTNARRTLMDMRKSNYHADVDEAESTAPHSSAAPVQVAPPKQRLSVAQVPFTVGAPSDAAATSAAAPPSPKHRAPIATPAAAVAEAVSNLVNVVGTSSAEPVADERPPVAAKRQSVALPTGADGKPVPPPKPAVPATKPALPPKPF